MLYTTFRVAESEYKLRLPVKVIADIERKLGGRSIIGLFGNGDIKDLPNVTAIATVLHGALQTYHHGITLDKTYEILEEYLASGGSYAGIISEFVELLKVSGFFREAPDSSQELTE